jgi:hypothetical protein
MPKKLSPIPAPNQLKLRQSLSIPGLLAGVRKGFESIKEHRIKTIGYKLTEVLMAALARFGLKYPSLLQFDPSGRARVAGWLAFFLRASWKLPKSTPSS